jgi:cell division protein FtsQ
LRAQIGQIHREKNGDFLLIPQVGAHKIVFGTAKNDKDVEDKFNKLIVFYKEGLPFEGWNKYNLINLKYDKQIVCSKKE